MHISSSSEFQMHCLKKTQLFRINQLIIDHDDFDLFRREINNFSLMLPVSPLDDVQNRIVESLFHDVPFVLYSARNSTECVNWKNSLP